MPSKNYSTRLGRYFKDDKERQLLKTEYDNRLTKISYWKKHWKYDININDYDDFAKHSKAISKIQKIHDFFCNLDKSNIKTEAELVLYGKFARNIELAWGSRDYILTLRKLNTKPVFKFPSEASTDSDDSD